MRSRDGRLRLRQDDDRSLLWPRVTGWPFVDADDLHPAANLAKMQAGIPLTDDDRWPWLDSVGDADTERSTTRASSVIVGCSALKRTLPRPAAHADPALRVVYLHG